MATTLLNVPVSGELYGEFNLMTSEWTDGLVPKMVRQCVQAGTEGSDNRKWIIFDGPVDAVWIENMNTVLDDNKTLCLANSERIKLPTTLHMMFEASHTRPWIYIKCVLGVGIYFENADRQEGITIGPEQSQGSTSLKTTTF